MTIPPHPSGDSSHKTTEETSENSQFPALLAKSQEEQHLSTLPLPRLTNTQNEAVNKNSKQPISLIILSAIAILILGLTIDNFWLGMSGALVALLVSLQEISPTLRQWFNNLLPPSKRSQLIAFLGTIIAIAGLLKFVGFYQSVGNWLAQAKWDEFGSWAEWIGAVGQIMIAVVTAYIAWRQYIISKDLTIQQNLITQQQTIDAYFQGICELALDDEGLLEDWPQERVFCEGRTAAILSSVDANGKAKVLRFLSQSRLLTPLRRDNHLGRPMLDGQGGYQEDRANGVRVIDLNVILAGVNLSGTDLRWTELSDANLVRTNLSCCDLAHANLTRSILYEANLTGADMKGVQLFYSSLETASPRSRTHPPDYHTGAYTGAVVEGANFTGVLRLNEQQRYYCCAWCGKESRQTIPGGCEGIPNKLGR